MKLFKSSEDKAAIADAEAAYQAFVTALASADPSTATRLAEEFGADPKVAVLGDRERRKLGEVAFLKYADEVLADDHLTAEEEDALGAVAEAMDVDQADVERNGEVFTRLQVAKLNDGRLPVVQQPRLMAKKGEVVHLETAAALMKEVAVREWHGASQGVSFRVAKGVRYRVGATRGHLVTVGTQLQVADSGILAITSTRAAYLGDRKTLDMPYAKVMGMHQYSDAIQFSLSNRQTAPLFRVSTNTDVLGALLTAAISTAMA
jgi:hypothetical protein